jgi:hypothetical protein
LAGSDYNLYEAARLFESAFNGVVFRALVHGFAFYSVRRVNLLNALSKHARTANLDNVSDFCNFFVATSKPRGSQPYGLYQKKEYHQVMTSSREAHFWRFYAF